MTSSPSYSSTQPISDIVSSGATTMVQAVDVYTERQKKRYQKILLAKQQIFLVEKDFSLLVEANLMDELIQLAEDLDPVTKAENYEMIADKRTFDDTKTEKNGIEEGGDEEESDDDEDEDYDFESPDEDVDDDDEDMDTSEKNKQNDLSIVQKAIENQNRDHMDASTQTNNESDSIVFNQETPEQQEIEPDHTYGTKSFYELK
jgi:hypothetical protein